ncbi:hypothetical protein CU669_15930 [Paramagnetospirillum kuznetsovii]|uniref:diguanylate cyclase n=1 Tax=Paramagnetospirillum kuznetsovii TaxID=2053833 RepID=A0A364NV09_9PROT|nr:sensor domain-containing diguanylate cyclase [Paramagnetospirillum kuznetsovii]RAU20919.1 hypothetical protein CU669_15930 [Paramagnetospirillum kuznetsovii]
MVDEVNVARGSLTAKGGWLSIAVIWTALLLLTIHVYIDLSRSYADARERGIRLATSYVRLVAEHALGTFERADMVLEQAVKLPTTADMAASKSLDPMRRRDLESRLVALQSKATAIVSMTMTDQDGTVFVNSVGTPPGGSLGDRGYFLELKAGPGDGPVVSEVVKGRVSNKWGIQVARRIVGPKGEFAGMVVANIGMTSYMEGFYGGLALGPGSVVSLRDGKHRLLVRHPVSESLFGKVIKSDGAAQILDSGDDEGWFDSVSPIDGAKRVAAIRKLPKYDIYAVVGIAESEVMGAWSKSRDQAIIILALALLVAVVATVMSYWKGQLDKTLGAQLSFQDALLETLPIPIFARDRDGRFVTCNMAYESFFGRPRASLSGRTIFEVFPADVAQSYAASDNEIMLGAGNKTYETDLARADGSVRKVIIDKARYDDAEGKPAGIVGTVIDITERQTMETELRRLATTDPLTGVGNRRHFLDLAATELSRVQRHDRKLSVIMFDLDHFKRINDGYGHGVGDDAIKAVADSCVATLRDIDVVGRMGGEEFAIMLPETELEPALEVAKRLHDKIGEITIRTDRGTLTLTASFGVAQVKEEDMDIDAALRRADAAMYQAKEAGRDRVFVGD